MVTRHSVKRENRQSHAVVMACGPYTPSFASNEWVPPQLAFGPMSIPNTADPPSMIGSQQGVCWNSGDQLPVMRDAMASTIAR